MTPFDYMPALATALGSASYQTEVARTRVVAAYADRAVRRAIRADIRKAQSKLRDAMKALQAMDTAARTAMDRR